MNLIFDKGAEMSQRSLALRLLLHHNGNAWR